MKKIGRLRKSRDKWKAKAVDRAIDMREMRKKIKRQEKRIQTKKKHLKIQHQEKKLKTLIA